jgi:hypothetical protein
MEPSSLGPGFGMAAALVASLAWTLVSLIARDLTTQFPSLSLRGARDVASGDRRRAHRGRHRHSEPLTGLVVSRAFPSARLDCLGVEPAPPAC